MAHPGFLSILEQDRSTPETDGTILLERRHIAENAVVHEIWHTPFDRFLHLRARRMHQVAKMVQDRLRKIRRFADVRIHPRISFTHKCSTAGFAQMKPAPP